MSNLERAKRIKGWMNDRELEWLYTQAQSRSIIVEIGVYYGRSTVALGLGAQHQKHAWVHAIDSWQGDGDNAKFLTEYLTEEGCRRVHEEAIDNVAGLPVSLLVETSNVACGLFPVASVDMLFLDGAHDYDSVNEDLANWLPRMRQDGLICGHDYNPNWPGVIQAVNQRFGKVKVVPNTSIWYV